MNKKNNSLIWLVLIVVGLYYLSQHAPAARTGLITPGVVEDGFSLFSKTDLPIVKDTPEKITMNLNDVKMTFAQPANGWTDMSFDDSGWTDLTLPYSTGTYTWSETTSWLYGTREGQCPTVPPGCLDWPAWSDWRAYGRYGYYQYCKASCTMATGSGWPVSQSTLYFRKKFDIPAGNIQGTYIKVNTALTQPIDTSGQYGECQVNGNPITIRKSSKQRSCKYNWGYNEGILLTDISQYVHPGQNILTCRIPKGPVIGAVSVEAYTFSASSCRYYNSGQGETIATSIGYQVAMGEDCGSETISECFFNNFDMYTNVRRQYSGYALRTGTVDFGGSENAITLTGSPEVYMSVAADSNYIKTKNLNGKSFRANVDFIAPTCERNSCGQGFGISVSGQEVYSSGITTTGLLEVIPRFLEPTMSDVYFQGQKLKTVDTSTQNLTVSFYVNGYSPDNSYARPQLTIYNARYQLPFNCHKEPGDMLAIESFTGGQEIGLYSTRYAVKSFCLEHPIVVTDATGSRTTAEPYQRWILGNTTFIPADQTWSVFYIFHNDGSIPVVCGSDYYDVKNNRCLNASGIVQICSQGQFDPALGVCVVQPQSINLCPEGGRYDTAQNKCIYNPPIQYICEVGEYSSVSGKCELKPANITLCPEKSSYNPSSGFCEMYPSRQIICDPFYAYSATYDKCIRQPDTNIICAENTVFNLATDRCEYTPESVNVCLTPFNYNMNTQKCEYKPSENIICNGGNYDSTNNVCVKTPPVDYSCKEGTLYLDKNGAYSCVYTPNVNTLCSTGVYSSERKACVVASTGTCTKGIFVNGYCQYDPDVTCLQGTYDKTKNACVYQPNLQYLCIGGTLITLQDGKQICQITPPTTYVCKAGCYYDTKLSKCACLQAGESLPYGAQQVVTVNTVNQTQVITQPLFITQTKTSYLILWIVGGLFLYYVIIEAGPNRGFFKKKRK